MCTAVHTHMPIYIVKIYRGEGGGNSIPVSPPSVCNPANLSDPSLLLYDDLCVASDAGTKWSGEGQCLIKGVGVKRLSSPKHGSHGFNACTDDVVVGVL